MRGTEDIEIADLTELSAGYLRREKQLFRRYLLIEDTFNRRCTIVIGQRGVGKTTLALQHLLNRFGRKPDIPKGLYVPCDHYLLQGKSLYDIAEAFSLIGGEEICFDEVHHYADWSRELKSIIDTFPDIRLLVTGSSALEIEKSSHDLSRRAVNRELFGLSFREFIALETGVQLPSHSLGRVLSDHVDIARAVVDSLAGEGHKVMALFEKYLAVGYYPYYREFPEREDFYTTIRQNVDRSLESDLLAVHTRLTGNSLKRIRQLMIRIASTAPFSLELKRLCNMLHISDERTLRDYLRLLEKLRLIRLLPGAGSLNSEFSKPEKVYLDNATATCALTVGKTVERGNLREIFFYASLAPRHQLSAARTGDFIVDGKLIFEIGGKGKTFKQIKELENSYLAVDNTETGQGAKIPLWLFGFLY
jgi:uncharacterized protein